MFFSFSYVFLFQLCFSLSVMFFSFSYVFLFQLCFSLSVMFFSFLFLLGYFLFSLSVFFLT
jgi:hypothetical protein